VKGGLNKRSGFYCVFLFCKRCLVKKTADEFTGCLHSMKSQNFIVFFFMRELNSTFDTVQNIDNILLQILSMYDSECIVLHSVSKF